MKITKKLQSDLIRILADMERAQAYLNSPRVAVCTVHDQATTTLHYTRAFVPGLDKPGDGKPLTVTAKDIGSDLCGLPEAIRKLKYLLTASTNL